MSGYFILNAISLMISGFLFNINGYIPIFISLTCTIISFLLSTLFVEPLPYDTVLESTNRNYKKVSKHFFENIRNDFRRSIKNFIISFKFIMKSGRLRCLLMFSSIMNSLVCIYAAYQVTIFNEFEISASIIGIIFAMLEITAGISAKKQDKFHNRFRNKSLTVLSIGAVSSCIMIGAGHYVTDNLIIIVSIFIVALIIKYATVGIYNVLIDKYYGNFTNEKIDSKIYSAKAFFDNISSVFLGIVAAYLLEAVSIPVAFLILSVMFSALFGFVIFYSRNKLGLKPSEYSAHELQYSDLSEYKSGKEKSEAS